MVQGVVARDRIARPPSVGLLAVALGLLALNALIGGAMLVAAPTGAAMGISTDLLAGSPFRDYLWPGVLLFAVIGVPAGIVAYGVWARPRWPSLGFVERITGRRSAWAASLAVAVTLAVWILVQMSYFRFFLQPVLLVWAAVIVVLTLWPAGRRWFVI
jgi:hypothetical protein